MIVNFALNFYKEMLESLENKLKDLCKQNWELIQRVQELEQQNDELTKKLNTYQDLAA